MQIVKKVGARFVIDSTILPSSCNKPDLINALYKYILDKYKFSKGKYTLKNINDDLIDLLKREGKI